MRKKIISAVVAVALGFVAWDSFYVINETEQGVLTHFGKISPPVRQPGSISSGRGRSRKSTRSIGASTRSRIFPTNC